jgi:hypothetical protein
MAIEAAERLQLLAHRCRATKIYNGMTNTADQ